jgi:hypothetical protein
MKLTTPTTSLTSASILSLDSLKKTKTDEELVSWVNEKYKSIKQARGKLERQWYTNIAFYMGKQNISIVTTSASASGNNFRLIVPDAPPWRVRLISNKVRPMLRTELAKVTSQKPTAMVIPASDDDKDIFAARAGETIWESTYSRKHIKATLRKTMLWTLLTGTGFIKDWWDERITVPGEQSLGDFCIMPETPFHIFVPDFQEEEIEYQPYVIHASAKSPEWVRANYRELVNEINPNTASARDILDDSFLNMVGSNQLNKDSVLCLELWAKPGALKQFPNGAMVTILGDTIVQAVEGLPYLHQEYPFTKFNHIPTGGFYGESTITDLVPLQKEYNRTRSQIIEAKNRMAKPQLLAAEGSVDPTKMTTEPGQVILYKLGMPAPAPLPLQSLPPYVLQELDRIQMDMDDISGQHEVTKGRVPPGVSAATAISYLQEQDDSKLSHTVDSIEDGIEKVARHTLSHVNQYWDVPRVIKTVGDNGSFDALVFKGSDLGGNTDIRVEAGSALPQSKAAKQAFIMDMMKFGWIDPAKGLQVLEIGGITKLYSELQTDIRHAQRENLRMQNGQPVSPNTWDNHAVHVEIHNNFRKNQAFENLPPEVQQLFEMHVQMHQLVAAGGVPPAPVMDPNNPGASAPSAMPGQPPQQQEIMGPVQQPNEGANTNGGY